MANPQLENGYLRIATELAEEFARRKFTGEEFAILWVVLRKTYGFNRKKDMISYSQFCIASGLNKRSVGRAIKSMKIKRVLTITETIPHRTFQLNKNYNEWVVKKRLTSGSADATNEAVAPMLPAGSNPPHVGGSNPPHVGGSADATHNKQIDKKTVIFGVDSLKTEIKNLQNLQHDDSWIKNHLLMRNIPESIVDEAFGRKY